jgi:Sulfotransferase family
MPLPNFIIGGARRGGTTSLYYGIRRHPEICLYPHSELNYFVEEEVRGRKWRDEPADPERWEATHSIENYAALFTGCDEARAIGHKGADLLFWHPAHERIKRFVPDVRFIFTLRHPVKRAWSHYWAERAKGRETLSFEAALAAEDTRSAKSDWAHYHLSYRARGCYDKSLQRFFETFQRERVLVVTLEEKSARPQETLQKIYRFLGVNPDLGFDLADTRRQQGWATLPRSWTRREGIRQLVAGYESLTDALVRKIARSKDSRRTMRNFLQRPFREAVRTVSMPETAKVELQEIYAPHIDALESLLGRSFGEWNS